MNPTQQNQSSYGRSVFVGGIPLTTSYNELFEYLSFFGQVLELDLPRHRKTKVLRGYARATFASALGAQKLLQQNTHKLQGLDIGISLWKTQTEYLQEKDDMVGKKVHVKFPPETTEAELKAYFGPYGISENFVFKTDPYTRNPRHFCYMVFKNEDQASRVVENSPHFINNKKIVCQMSKPAHLEQQARKKKQRMARLTAHHQQNLKAAEADLLQTNDGREIDIRWAVSIPKSHELFLDYPELYSQTQQFKKRSLRQRQALGENPTKDSLCSEISTRQIGGKPSINPGSNPKLSIQFIKPTSKGYFKHRPLLAPSLGEPHQAFNLLFRVKQPGRAADRPEPYPRASLH